MRGGRHRGEVGADARLGHGDGGDQLAGGDAGQPALALLVGAVAQEVRQADVVVQGEPEPGTADAGGLDLLADHQVVAEVVDAAAAVLARGWPCRGSRARRPRRRARGARCRPRSHSRWWGTTSLSSQRAEAGAEGLVLVVEEVTSHRLLSSERDRVASSRLPTPTANGPARRGAPVRHLARDRRSDETDSRRIPGRARRGCPFGIWRGIVAVIGTGSRQNPRLRPPGAARSASGAGSSQ